MRKRKAVISASINQKYINILDDEVDRRNKILLENDEFAELFSRSDLIRLGLEKFCEHINKISSKTAR